MKAMIFAAGLGTRLLPLTAQKPKALIEVYGIPMLGRLIQRIKSVGIDQIIINTHHFPDQIKTYLDQNKNFDIEIAISDEQQDLLDTGGGLAQARWFLEGSGPFLVHNVDIFTDLDLSGMIENHIKHKPLVTLAVRHRDSSRYLLFNEQMDLNGWLNEKTKETILVDQPAVPLKKLAFSGIHVIDPGIFDYFKEARPSRIINRYLEIANQERIMGFEHDDGYFVDMGSGKGLKKAEKYLKNIDN